MPINVAVLSYQEYLIEALKLLSSQFNIQPVYSSTLSKKHRKKGIGGALFEATIKIAFEEKLNGMTWQVLDWNTPAINFYKKYKANISSAWLNGKLTKNQLKDLSLKIN